MVTPHQNLRLELFMNEIGLLCLKLTYLELSQQVEWTVKPFQFQQGEEKA